MHHMLPLVNLPPAWEGVDGRAGKGVESARPGTLLGGGDTEGPIEEWAVVLGVLVVPVVSEGKDQCGQVFVSGPSLCSPLWTRVLGGATYHWYGVPGGYTTAPLSVLELRGLSTLVAGLA